MLDREKEKLGGGETGNYYPIPREAQALPEGLMIVLVPMLLTSWRSSDGGL